VHQAVEACVRTHSEVQPVAEWIDPYRELRERYRALYPALQAITEETP
jgi:xylulokinase